MPLAACSQIARGVIHGLEYCHDQVVVYLFFLFNLIFNLIKGIIHRSIRASHVFITHQGQVRISGFRYAIELKVSILSMINVLKLETKDKRRSHEYRFEEVGLPWKAPELLEQNCQGFGTKIDIYRFFIFLSVKLLSVLMTGVELYKSMV